MDLNKKVLPIILSATILVAGFFAFTPINEASTVHTIVMANSARLSEASDSADAAGDDITITCPDDSNGCHILEVYVRENDGNAGAANDINLDAATANINGVAATITSDLTVNIDEQFKLIPTVSGVAIGAGDTLVIEVDTGSATYSATVIASVEGNTDIDVEIPAQ